MEIWQNENPAGFKQILFAQGFTGERHIPVKEETLQAWQMEADGCYRGTTYGEVLKRDIKIARKCNTRNSELLIVS